MSKLAPPSDRNYGKSVGGTLLTLLERVGARIPQPFSLFLYIFIILAILSMVFAGQTVQLPGAAKSITVNSFVSVDGIIYLLTNMVDNFIGFPALGIVLAMVMAVGVAQGSGALESAVRAAMVRVPPRMVPYAVAFVAAQGHVLSDASYFVIAPLGALVFKAAGRNPLAGLIGSYACLQAGYAGGFLLGTLDATYAGITTPSAALIDASAPTHIAMNLFYTAAAGLVLPILGGWLIVHVLEPRLPKALSHKNEEVVKFGVTAREKKGLLLAFAGLMIYIGIALTAWLIPGSPFQSETGGLVPSPFTASLVPLIAFSFIIFGIIYGVVAGTITRDQGVPALMAKSVANIASLIVLFFIIGQVFGLIKWTNLGTLLAVSLANAAESWGIAGFGALILVAIVSGVLNMVITSGSGLWSLVGPVMIPSMMLVGLSPAAIQAAHRIGDSTTSLITPLSVFLFWLLGVAKEYEPDLKVGTLIARLSIFVPVYFAGWLAVLAIFYFAGLPLGPGTGFHLNK